MLTPSIVDERAASLSRVPSQSGHVVNTTARSTKARRVWRTICFTSSAISVRSRLGSKSG